MINYKETDFSRWAVEKFGKPQRRNYEGGVDVVINFTGGDTWAPTLRCVKRGGKILVCGATAGYDPKENDSGLRTGRKIISKKGRWLLRKYLYFMAMRVVHRSPFFKGYYEHKQKGSSRPLEKKEALCAVIIKLVRILFALMRDRRMFTEELRCAQAA